MSNIDIKVTADVVDLQAKFALAKAESSAFSLELNKLAKEAAAAGGPNDELKAKIYAVAEQSTVAKAKVAELRTEIKTATDTSGGFAGALGEINPLLGAFGVALSIGAVEQFGQSLLENAAHIEHEAEVLGLSSSAYQAFAKSAELAEVPIDTVEGALKRFNAAQGKAQEGSIAQAAAFRELGVDARLPAEEALPAVASALLAMSDTAERARIETLLFGKSGQELNPVLEQWAEGVDGLTRKLNDLGVMLDPEITAKAEAAKKEMTLFSEQLRTGVVDAAVAAYPYLKKIGDELLLISGLQGVLDQLPKPGEKEDVRVTAAPIDPNADYRAEIAGLNALDTKLVEREALTGKIRQAQLALMDATERGDAAGIRTSTEVISDLQKQLDALNKPPHVSNKAANEAREAADAQTQAWVQANEKRIESDEHTNAFLLETGRETLDQFETQARSLEDQRYAVALDGLHRREAADAGNKVALAKDSADKQVIYQDYVDRLTALDQQYQLKKQQIARIELQEFERDENAKLERGLALYESDFKAHQISAEQAHDLEQQLTLAIEREVLARFDAENSGLKAGNEAYAKAMKERQAIVDGFAKHVEEQDNSLKDEEAQKWRQLADSIRSSFNSALDNMLFHGGTFRQFMQSVAIGIAEAFLQMGEKIAEDWIERQIAQIAATQTSQAAQTGAVVAGQAAQTAAVAAGAGAKSLVSAEADSKSILNAAYTSAAEAYKSVMEAVPPPANLILAPIAAAGTFAAVAAFDVISAEGGLDRVRYNGQLIQAHVDESVTPANVAIPQRDFFSDSRVRDFLGAGARKFDGSLSGGAAAMNGATHYHSHEWNIGSDFSPDHILRNPTKRRIFERYIENEFAKAVK